MDLPILIRQRLKELGTDASLLLARAIEPAGPHFEDVAIDQARADEPRVCSELLAER